MKTVVLRTADGRVVCERCLVAETPAPSVHTFFMRFTIDVVFLARDGEVMKVVPSLRPWRTAAARRAKAVLELPAGEAERRGIRPGIRLDLSLSADPSSGPAADHPPVSG